MNANTEIMYWMSNKAWYHIDETNDTFVIEDNAPERAKKSFIKWLLINGELESEFDEFANKILKNGN